MILATLVLLLLPSELLCIQVIVPETERRTTLFASIILRCDYSTSANPQDVLVTWKFKSFCKDPVLEYYTTGYQAALQLGQDPANDCPDRQRTIRTVIQKRGINEPTLGPEYRERKITIQNKADLVITEVMWWDNGVYFCSIDAAGDTSGDSDREVKLIVYRESENGAVLEDVRGVYWLTVLLIILGALLLIMLLCICCCQCCPQACCCYVRCPCCPQTCCCPEKAVMQHRMLKEAQKAMVPWVHGQPIYAPISSHASSQGVPILHSGSFSDYPVKQNFAMTPVQLSAMALQQQPPPPRHGNGSVQPGLHGNGQVLDYLEHQVRELDAGPPPPAPHGVPYVLALQPQIQPQPQPPPPAVPYTPRPPSMLSALDGLGVQGERRVITLPPIIKRMPSFSSGRGDAGRDRARGGALLSSQSSGSTNRSAGGLPYSSRGFRDAFLPPKRRVLRDYNDDSDRENRRGRTAQRESWEGGGASGRARAGGSGRRSRSQDLMEELHARGPRGEKSFSPPRRRKESWSSDEEEGGKNWSKGKDWAEKPPSYFSIKNQRGHGNQRKDYHQFSDRSSHGSNSVVI
ncbi:unnamed protein product [Tetraodon nigroviridis]|uniref:Chromosome 2 SCAF14781, whole genome shotgun sequence n=1 Tax=Tetraodon nigroviridis TaxID=99883 RepID=Q4S0L1_TETNG|nr:unnamed protein product [Tetraodon nigroviridis]